MIKLTQLIRGMRGYKRASDRKRAVKQLHKRGYNYFVFYTDVRTPYALQYSHASWVHPSTYELKGEHA